ncbi:MAG: phage tail assembly chaperone [Candidatus Omnitrophica bacterium]|nr:phage tail assembly chaperone [Candidatus Omnitrophota bacterium]
MALLTRDDILQVSDLDRKVINVPEWNGDVMVRTMTGAERDNFEQSLFDQKGKSTKANMDNLRAKLLAKCLVNEEGSKLFSEKDIGKLGEKSAKVLDRLYTIARDMNGIGADDEEEMIKN